MALRSYVRDLFITSPPAAVGEAGLDAAGHLLIHNGTAVDTYMPSGPLLGALANDAVATTETVLATFSLPANYLLANSVLAVQFMGQVSSTATLTYKMRLGTTGLITDALLATWATSAAGVANTHTSLDALVHCLTAGAAGTAYAGGRAFLGNAVLLPVAAAAVSAAVNTTVANKLTITVVQSAVQTLTSRTAVLERIA